MLLGRAQGDEHQQSSTRSTSTDSDVTSSGDRIANVLNCKHSSYVDEQARSSSTYSSQETTDHTVAQRENRKVEVAWVYRCTSSKFCDKTFPTMYKLQQHKENTDHRRLRKGRDDHRSISRPVSLFVRFPVSLSERLHILERDPRLMPVQSANLHTEAKLASEGCAAVLSRSLGEAAESSLGGSAPESTASSQALQQPLVCPVKSCKQSFRTEKELIEHYVSTDHRKLKVRHRPGPNPEASTARLPTAGSLVTAPASTRTVSVRSSPTCRKSRSPVRVLSA